MWQYVSYNSCPMIPCVMWQCVWYDSMCQYVSVDFMCHVTICLMCVSMCLHTIHERTCVNKDNRRETSKEKKCCSFHEWYACCDCNTDHFCVSVYVYDRKNTLFLMGTAALYVEKVILTSPKLNSVVVSFFNEFIYMLGAFILIDLDIPMCAMTQGGFHVA